MYQGDIRLGDTLYFHFTTRRFTTGVPFTLAGSPAISAYPQDSTTQLTAGITLTVDLDSVTGLNSVKVVATGGNGYAAAINYSLVITAGTVDSVSVVGEVIGSFSIEARSALMPTTAARTLDVTATGEAGIDWNNIGGPTTAVNLSGTTIKTATDVEADTQNIQTRLPVALSANGNMQSNIAEIDGDDLAANNLWSLFSWRGNVAAGTLSTTQATTDLIGYGDDLFNNRWLIYFLSGSAPEWQVALVTDYDSATGLLTFAPALSTPPLAADYFMLYPAATGLAVGNRTGSVDSVVDPVTVGTNNDKTGYSIGVGGIAATAFAANAIDAAALDPSAGQEIADRILLRGLQTGADGPRTVQDALRTLRNRVAIATGGATDVYEEDDTTVAWSAAATRDASANNITEIVPT